MAIRNRAITTSPQQLARRTVLCAHSVDVECTPTRVPTRPAEEHRGVFLHEDLMHVTAMHVPTQEHVPLSRLVSI
jgi:hypothetical protein